MPEDRSTGRSVSSGAALVKARSTPESGIPPGEVHYEFVFPITDQMRAATTQRARHGLMWAEILRTRVESVGPALDRVPDRKLEGFDGSIGGETRGPVTYRMPRHQFLRIATPAALTPTRVIGAEGQAMSSVDAQLHVRAAASYRQSLSTLDAPRREIIRSRVGSALEGFLREQGDSEASVTEALRVAERIAEKIGRIDDLALQTLVDRDPLSRPSVTRLDFTPEAALSHLLAFDNTIDHLLAAARSRAAGARLAAQTLDQAIVALDGFDSAWKIRGELEAAASAIGRQREGAMLPRAEREYLELLDRYRTALVHAGAVGPNVQRDFDSRLRDFHRTLTAVLVPLGQTALSNLLVRVDDALNRGEPYLKRLYAELVLVLPQAGPYSGAAVEVLEPKLRRLTHDFPILGYEKLARDVLRAYGTFRSLKTLHQDYPPDWRFAWNANHDLRRWRTRALRAQRLLSDPEKVWLAQDLVEFALDRAQVPSKHFLRDVARRKAQAVSDDSGAWAPILGVISVALFFVPAGALLSALARGGVLAADAVVLKDQIEDQLTAETLAEVGLTGEAPSGWWLVLAMVSLGFSLVDVARIVRVRPQQLLDAVSEDGLDALLRHQGTGQRDLAVRALRDLERVGSRMPRPLASAYAKLIRGSGVAALSPSERAALAQAIRAAPDLAGRQAVALARSQAAVPVTRQLSQAEIARLRSLHPSLPDYMHRRPRISADAETERQIAAILRTAGQSGGRYQAVRSASGELAVIEKVHAAISTTSLRVLRPTNRPGDVTPDLAVVSTARGLYHVETTTPTLANRRQRGPVRGSGSSARPAPPIDRTRPATSREIAQAFRRKLDSGQISRSRPGVIVVNIQRAPVGGPLLTARQIQKLESRIASRPDVWELLVLVPGPQGRRFMRVGGRDSGLGLAEGMVAGQ